MPSPPSQVLLIGVDGGASEVRAHQVLVLSAEGALSLALGPASSSMCYDRVPGFEPVPVAEQLRALEQKRVRPSALEVRQGKLCVEAAASAILSVASQAEAERALVGMCMPGIKTADQRGIAVLKNGPRQPEFLEQLERELERGGLALARPIHALVSDGEACALGEECDAQGTFRGVQNAYYLGGGTGLAEAFKLAGEVVGLDALSATLSKAWQMESRLGAGFEELVSVRGANERYAARTGRGAPQHPDEFVEARARDGDRIAQAVLTEAGEALAELLFARITALDAGKKGAARARHPRPHTRLDRIVIGQRLGQLYADPELARCLRDPAEARLASELGAVRDAALRAHYLEGASLRAGLVHASVLRVAPALGAAALAWRTGSKGASTRAVQG